MIAEAPHRIIEPAAPNTPRVKPRLPRRNPGLHNAMTNPSHHRRVLRSCTSSTVAVPNLFLLTRAPGPRPPARADYGRLIPVCINTINLASRRRHLALRTMDVLGHGPRRLVPGVRSVPEANGGPGHSEDAATGLAVDHLGPT